MRLIAYAGRHATAVMAAGVLLGLVVPPLASLARPLLLPTVLVPFTLALVRLDWSAALAWRRRPALLALLVVWVLGASPLLVWAVTQAMLPAGFPDPLARALVLAAAASPIVSSVVFALFLRLDAALAVVVVLACTALVPFTLPPIAGALAGVAIGMPVAELALRLGGLVGVSFAAAALVRRLASPAALEARRETLDGIAVLNLLVFGLAVMDGVTAYAIERPGFVAVAIVAAYGFNLLLQGVGALVFAALGRARALTVALVSGNCNMGLVLVALEGRADFETTVFFALGQLPMYTLPALLGPVYRRFALGPGPAR